MDERASDASEARRVRVCALGNVSETGVSVQVEAPTPAPGPRGVHISGSR
jgi:hypothetical protein